MPGSYYFDMVVIGGGTTGTAVARDLAMRGFTNILLVEKNDLGAGTSGRCHSNLHGGGRYIAMILRRPRNVQENRILRKIAPHTIDQSMAYLSRLMMRGSSIRKSLLKMPMQLGCITGVDPEQVMRRSLYYQETSTGLKPTTPVSTLPLERIPGNRCGQAGATIWVHHEILKIEVSG